VNSLSEQYKEGMLFLHEQLVAIINQMTIPLIEVSLVISKYTKTLTSRLIENAANFGELIPDVLLTPQPLEDIGKEQAAQVQTNDGEEVVNGSMINPIAQMDPSILISRTDIDRMDILDTVIRTAINSKEIPLINSLHVLRDWEHLVRIQLAKAKTPGQLFSPLEIPDGY
jgi:hypothetical protein